VNSAGFIVRMAARELRAAPRRLLLLMGTVAVGVAALVAINSFTDNLQDSVRVQARALLGADLALVSRQAFSPRVEALLDTLSSSSRLARVTSFAGMAYVPRTDGTRLVQVAALDGHYPFYGEIRTEPANAWAELQSGRFVVVDPSLLTALNARVGDTVALGEGRFVITGTIRSAPSDAGVRFAFGPRIYIPARYLPETKLLGFGARVEHEAFLQTPANVSPEALVEKYRAPLRVERVRLRTVADDQRNLTDVLTWLSGYLGLVALIALLLGGIGVASAVVVFVRQRSDSVAVLRCLGASSGAIFAIYLLEAGVMGLAGSAAGAALGLVVQRFLPSVLSGLLPVEVVPSVSWNAVGLGFGMGLWVSLVFALLPLLTVRRITPLSALRRRYEPARLLWDRWSVVAGLLLIATAVALAAHQVGSWRRGVLFSAGIGAALIILWAAAWALTRVMRRWLPSRWPYVWRQGLANLHRPANQTVTLVLAIGFGAFLLGTLYLIQFNLLRQLSVTSGPERPNLVLFDIQPDQLPGVQQALREAGLPSGTATPIVPMRILSVKGRPVTQLLAGTPSDRGDGPSNAWVFRREYRSTYRDSIVGSERVVSGEWSGRSQSPPRISIERDLAAELGVVVGDEIVWDVQGVSISTRVGSLREVEWARFEPNFFVVFPADALEAAPQTYVTLTRVTDAAVRGRFQRRLAERFGNVSTLDLTLLQEALEQLVERVVLAIRFMALFSLGVGVLVLIGALATSRFQRVREGALLRTLGATRGQVFRVVLAEYFTLGVLASTVALLLATAAGWAVSRFVFDGSFRLPALPLTALVLLVVGLTVIVGLVNSRDVVRRPPLEVLRQDG
jgi:putative ABC transport system permease protein